jgi:RNA polymerase sigma-70 factor (ECF subfamily)
MTFEEQAMPLFASLYNYARWLTGEPHEAEDLVQETYLKALRGFASFRPGTNFRAWMFRILRNTFLTSRTGLRATAMQPIEDDDQFVADGDPETTFLHHADAELLRQAILELPLEFREVLLLADVENMSYREVSEALSIPVGTVTSRLTRARAKVRKRIQEKR